MADPTRRLDEDESLESAKRRLLEHVSFVPPPLGVEGDCRLWKGYCTDKGYAQFRVHRKTRRAARVAYEIFVGPIPVGYVLDHLCRRRNCVNPEHLEPVTNRINLLRGNTFAARHAAKTHCVHGHEFTPENTHLYYYPKWKDRLPTRICKQCWTLDNRKRAEKARLKRAS